MINISHILRHLGGLGLAFGLSLPLWSAESTPKFTDDTHAYFEVLRSQFNADKVATINQLLKLSPAEAEVFWPIYREYEKELADLGDRKLELMKEFLKQFDESQGLTNDSARSLAKRWLDNLEQRTDLWKKYHKRLSEKLSSIRAAQFLQLEHQIALLIDLGIASEMPSLAPGGNLRPK